MHDKTKEDVKRNIYIERERYIPEHMIGLIHVTIEHELLSVETFTTG